MRTRAWGDISVYDDTFQVHMWLWSLLSSLYTIQITTQSIYFCLMQHIAAGPSLAEMPTLSSVKISLHRSSWARLPSLPQPQSDIQLEGDWTKTTWGEWFLLCNEKNIVFAEMIQLEMFINAETVYIDGCLTAALEFLKSSLRSCRKDYKLGTTAFEHYVEAIKHQTWV